MPAGFISEWWPASNRNRGRLHVGIPGRNKSESAADKRVALVVGNSAYRNVTPLDNPKNDAKLMAQTLRGLGFTLIGGDAQIDLNKSGIDRAVQSFGAQLRGADVGLFYYAGHGVQVRGANYLVPIDANPTSEADVDFQMLDTNLVLRQMEVAGTKLNLVILDACRNNPFGGRGLRATSGGLAQMQAPEGTLISYATQPGSVARDGSDGNSPYTKALVSSIKIAGLDIFETFNQVGLAVKRSTAGQQQPWVSSSPIDGKFYFVAPPAISIVPPVGAAPSLETEAAQAWSATKDTTSIMVLEAYIRRYSTTYFADIARARLDELKAASAKSSQQIPAVFPKEGGGGYLVQVTSQRNEADAQASFRALQSKFPSVLGARAPLIRRSDLGDKGVYYRGLIGPFETPDEALQFCGSLKSVGGQCVVQRN